MDEGWAELERMAQAAGAADAQLASKYPSQETIDRWRKLFGYSHTEAVKLIGDQRRDVTRERIPDAHWDLIRTEKQAAGHDRESYEHYLQLTSVFQGQSASVPAPDGSLMLLFRLGGVLDSAAKVQRVAGLQEPPVVQDASSEYGPVTFCVVDQDAKRKLEAWLTEQSVLQR